MSLPNWKGASAAYSKSYRILEIMGQNGHVIHNGCYPYGPKMCVSDDMENLIDALNKGDEEKIKGYNLLYPQLFTYLKEI